MSWRAVSEIRARIATVLNRPVVTESDKKMFYELKNRIQIEWDARLFNESNRKRISRSKTRILARVKQTSGLVVSVSNKQLSDARSLAVAKARSVLFADTSRRLLAGLKKQIIPPYGQFRHWLRTPVTVRMFLGLMALLTLAISSIDFGLPWDFVTTLGYGAIIMTALT